MKIYKNNVNVLTEVYNITSSIEHTTKPIYDITGQIITGEERCIYKYIITGFSAFYPFIFLNDSYRLELDTYFVEIPNSDDQHTLQYIPNGQVYVVCEGLKMKCVTIDQIVYIPLEALQMQKTTGQFLKILFKPVITVVCKTIEVKYNDMQSKLNLKLVFEEQRSNESISE